jgi:hypothetical protein
MIIKMNKVMNEHCEREYSYMKDVCKHLAWMMLYSLKKRICYDCGKVEPITNDMPVHQR